MPLLMTKVLWATLSLTGFIGAIVGFALPIIPGLPFLLLMLHSLKKCSPRLYQRLLQTRLALWVQKHEPKVMKKAV
ncbi:hypothetical protein FC26_GL001275 [Paucilactobacillus vaccinostercus DSM 20634]|jgi:uncharacterized membrane protein YbaN (DUF454 family)|uniref:Uncharacterized protein n=2 Tax=Paucilactobacillus vaccinostercus TaxID=176291 RepID=A0A0R2ADH0_9LACO|nr:hypothetical protein FC26_GL001275 [Paucilactobacillus vaccinostercus DSM 20634]RRG08421.1 MAG: DUF454 family protein [Lactobacillus sp.]